MPYLPSWESYVEKSEHLWRDPIEYLADIFVSITITAELTFPQTKMPDT